MKTLMQELETGFFDDHEDQGPYFGNMETFLEGAISALHFFSKTDTGTETIMLAIH